MKVYVISIEHHEFPHIVGVYDTHLAAEIAGKSLEKRLKDKSWDTDYSVSLTEIEMNKTDTYLFED